MAGKVRTYVYTSKKDAEKLLRMFDITNVPYAVLQRTTELAEAGVIATNQRGQVIGLCGLNVVSNQTWDHVKLYIPSQPKHVREIAQPFIHEDGLTQPQVKELTKFLIETALRFRRPNHFIIAFSTDKLFTGFLNGLGMKRIGAGYFPAHMPKISELFIASHLGGSKHARARR